MEIAIAVVKCHTVLIRWVVPQIQIAIRSVVTIGLAVGCAAKPPRRTIRSHPCGLGCNARAHGVGCASPTTILGARHINNPIGRAQGLGRSKESLPIFAAAWREKLCALRARVLVIRPASIDAICAFDKSTSRIVPLKRHSVAFS